MDRKRMIELLTNASVCFDRCMSPFCQSQLLSLNVHADECRDLSAKIASIVMDYLYETEDINEVQDLEKQAFLRHKKLEEEGEG